VHGAPGRPDRHPPVIRIRLVGVHPCVQSTARARRPGTGRGRHRFERSANSRRSLPEPAQTVARHTGAGRERRQPRDDESTRAIRPLTAGHVVDTRWICRLSWGRRRIPCKGVPAAIQVGRRRVAATSRAGWTLRRIAPQYATVGGDASASRQACGSASSGPPAGSSASVRTLLIKATRAGIPHPAPAPAAGRRVVPRRGSRSCPARRAPPPATASGHARRPSCAARRNPAVVAGRSVRQVVRSLPTYALQIRSAGAARAVRSTTTTGELAGRVAASRAERGIVLQDDRLGRIKERRWR
jgi:hypothetical protein